MTAISAALDAKLVQVFIHPPGAAVQAASLHKPQLSAQRIEIVLPRHPLNAPRPDESAEDIVRDIAAVSRIQAVPTLLDVLCEITGMGFAAVARVSEASWTLCAVKDSINFGLKPGGQLEVETTLCIEAKRTRTSILIEHASLDPTYRNHATPKLYHIESYVSVPIVMPDGRYFGNLCAIDPSPATLPAPKTLHMFEKFAALIALQLDGELQQETARHALRDERAASELREQFIAILGHDLRNPLQAVYATGELIERKSTDPLVKTLAARIRTNAIRMSSLIDDVLDFARARLGGGLGVDLATVEDLKTPLLAVVKEFQDAQADCRIAVDIAVGREVRCDVRRLQQVVSNLLGNALSHGASSTPVKLTARTDDDDLVPIGHSSIP